MELKEIIELVSLAITTIGLVATIVGSIFKGKLKEFIVKKMEEVENMHKTPVEKLQYVVEAVKDEYKLAKIVLNVEQFVEKIIDISKHINYKK